jgi:hypothetical protein
MQGKNEKQIPFGDDNQNDKNNQNDRNKKSWSGLRKPTPAAQSFCESQATARRPPCDWPLRLPLPKFTLTIFETPGSCMVTP